MIIASNLTNAKMRNSRIASIARELVAASGDNVFEDYFQFYESGKWMIETAREVLRIATRLSASADDYASMIPQLEENIGYISQEKMPEFNTSQASKELKRMLGEIKKSHTKWEKESSGEKKAPLLEDCDEWIGKLTSYAESYAESCENALRNRYSEDEANVRSLLDAIRDAGKLLDEGRD